jgi:hypothetical protein
MFLRISLVYYSSNHIWYVASQYIELVEVDFLDKSATSEDGATGDYLGDHIYTK